MCAIANAWNASLTFDFSLISIPKIFLDLIYKCCFYFFLDVQVSGMRMDTVIIKLIWAGLIGANVTYVHVVYF